MLRVRHVAYGWARGAERQGQANGTRRAGDEEAAEGEVDNMEAGEFFARIGLEHEGAAPNGHSAFRPAPAAHGGAGSSGAAAPAEGPAEDSGTE